MDGSVLITHHLDEIEAPAWEFIKDEAEQVGALSGKIESYDYKQANGRVTVLWDGFRLHAMAVTVRDDLNRTRCVRVLAKPRDRISAQKNVATAPAQEPLAAEFQAWWESAGVHLRGDSEDDKTFALHIWKSLQARSTPSTKDI